MANAEHIKALLKAYADGNDDRFFSVAMQVAAHEARSGHGKIAKELREIIDACKATRGLGQLRSIGKTRGAFTNVLNSSYPQSSLGRLGS